MNHKSSEQKIFQKDLPIFWYISLRFVKKRAKIDKDYFFKVDVHLKNQF